MNTLQDCLNECTRIDTARENCITAMNSCGLTTPIDASLGMLPHYFGCDKYIGPSLSTKTKASLDDANTAISQVITKKNNLKNVINTFCAPKGISISDQAIDEYHTYISNVGNTAFQVEYISNPSKNDYIDLGITLDNSYILSAKVRFPKGNLGDLYAPQCYQLFGSRSDTTIFGRTPILGFTAYSINNPGEDIIRAAYYFPSGDYIEKSNITLPAIIEFTDCKTVVTNTGTTFKKDLSGNIDGTNYTDSDISPQDIPTISTNCYIFNNTGKCPSNSRFYSAQIKNSNGTIIHNYLPYIIWGGCSWVPCVKDTVTNKFYYNSGPNTLNYGPIIK